MDQRGGWRDGGMCNWGGASVLHGQREAKKGEDEIHLVHLNKSNLASSF